MKQLLQFIKWAAHVYSAICGLIWLAQQFGFNA
jgi:hypothetical protein